MAPQCGVCVMSSKGNERRAERVYRENLRPLSVWQIVRFALVVGALAVVVFLVTGCARDTAEPVNMVPVRTVTKVAYRPGTETTVTVPATDEQIAGIIVDASRAAYLASGHNCPCPDDHFSNGRICGGNSAGSLAGGQKPFCSVGDVMKRPDLIELARRHLASRM